AVSLSCHDAAPPDLHTLSLHDALPIFHYARSTRLHQSPYLLQRHSDHYPIIPMSLALLRLTIDSFFKNLKSFLMTNQKILHNFKFCISNHMLILPDKYTIE